MNPASRTLVGVIALVFLLIGCGSSPRTNHYVLTGDASSIPDGDSPSLGVGPVEVPEYLNRNGLVIRQGNQLEISSTDRWGEPLEAGITRVVALNLAAALDTQDIRHFPWRASGAPDYGVGISVLALDADRQQASLVAEWQVKRPQSGDSVARRVSRLSLPLDGNSPGGEQLAAAYSELLSRLSLEISQVIKKDLAGEK